MGAMDQWEPSSPLAGRTMYGLKQLQTAHGTATQVGSKHPVLIRRIMPVSSMLSAARPRHQAFVITIKVTSFTARPKISGRLVFVRAK